MIGKICGLVCVILIGIAVVYWVQYPIDTKSLNEPNVDETGDKERTMIIKGVPSREPITIELPERKFITKEDIEKYDITEEDLKKKIAELTAKPKLEYAVSDQSFGNVAIVTDPVTNIQDVSYDGYTFKTDQLELAIHELINEERTEYGLRSLGHDSIITIIARDHSADMVRRNFFSHYNPNGLDPTQRGEIADYQCIKNYGTYYTEGIAENIFQNTLYDRVWYTNDIPTSYEWNSLDEIALSTVKGWMSSEGHRQNILTPDYSNEGIGVSVGNDHKIYITQDFC